MSDLNQLKSAAARYYDRSSYSSPAFITSATVAVLDDRSGTPQVSLLDVQTGEVTSLTSYKERILSLNASTTSERIVFGIDEGGNERQQLSEIAGNNGTPRRLTHAPDSIHEPGALSPDGATMLYRTNARDEATFDVVSLDLESMTSHTWLEAGGQVDPAAMSGDGQKILVVQRRGNLDSILLLVDRNGDVKTLTDESAKSTVSQPQFHPNGSEVWYLTDKDEEFVYLAAVNLESGQIRTIVKRDWDIERFKLSPDGSYAATSTNVDGASELAIMRTNNANESVAIKVPTGTMDRFTWSPDSSHVAFGYSTAEAPSSVYVSTTDGEIVLQASADSDAPPTSTPETIRYKTFDGREIPAFWFPPKGEGPFPVLVDVHGGPESQRRLQWTSAIPTIQFLQSLGMGVLSLNVRGSTGYGKSYTHLDDIEKRLDSVADVAACVDWLKSRDDVDPGRIAVMGQSYGGFMTLASLVFYPDLWRAGVNVVGIANFVSFLERTGPWRRKHRETEYGSLENDREFLERISPLNHIENITAPLMIIHGRNDPRVPLFEAEQVHEALTKRGQTVELLVFDDEGHGLSKRHNRIAGYAEAGRFLMEQLGLVTK